MSVICSSLIRHFIRLQLHRTRCNLRNPLQLWTALQIDILLGGATSAKSTLHPLLKVLNVADFLQIVLHHVCVSGLNEHLLSVFHLLELLLIVLLVLHDHGFVSIGLALLSVLDFGDVLCSKLSEFLFKHQLVLLLLHIGLDLVFASFQLHHDLFVSLLYRIGIVALSRPQKVKGFLPRGLKLLILVKSVFIDVSESCCVLFLFFLCIIK